jgi:hydroxypyruvate reductase
MRGRLVVAGIPQKPLRGRLVLLSVGKAAIAMARAAEECLGSRLSEGLVVTNSRHLPQGVPNNSNEPRAVARGWFENSLSAAAPLTSRLLFAGHPIPDARGLAAAREAEALVDGLGREDALLVLLSGGASALLPAPSAGLSLEDKARTTSLLLRAGATIQELNTVRKHLSRLKGGGLARRASPARVLTLVLSDVVGDDLSTIASGPTVPDPTTFADALGVLQRRGVLQKTPPTVRTHLEAGARGRVPETPKGSEAVFRRATTHVVGSSRRSVLAAAREATRLGFRPMVLTTRLEGEAREVARCLVSILREGAEGRRSGQRPICLLAGGETTVTVAGDGQGGRNQELAVAAAQGLDGFPGPAVVASLATDGIDGMSDAAGGVVDDQSARRARELGLPEPGAFLAQSDSRNFLGPLGDLILTGPTGTNVVDIVVLLAGAHGQGYNPRESRPLRPGGSRVRGRTRRRVS